MPNEPNASGVPAGAPLESSAKRCTRWLFWSATNSELPWIAIPPLMPSWNWPGAVPVEPKLRTNVPPGVNCWMRSL